MPTTHSVLPSCSAPGASVALFTGVSPISAGSYATTDRLCSGFTYTTCPGTWTVPANVIVTSPTDTGTVLRSTTTSPRAASTTKPVPWKLVSAMPETEYGMSYVTNTSDGVSFFSRGSVEVGSA